MRQPTEYDGGTILPHCPHCGQFCHIPKHYHVRIELGLTGPETSYYLPVHYYANSYCRRCRRRVRLGVVFDG
jgi:hypothetical protein